MIINASVRINAPLQTVWDVFSDIENWKQWNPVCRECRFETGHSLVRGTCISFSLNPMVLPIRIVPEVTHCEPGKKVIWKGGRLGINAEHEFLFEETDGGVVIKSTEYFKGPMLIFARLMFLPARLHALSLRLLDAIKEQSEARAAEQFMAG